MKNLMIFLIAYLYVHYVLVLPKVMHMHIKLMNSFGSGLSVLQKDDQDVGVVSTCAE